jgi:hypothetical protein|tara:strand:- start:163 stop:318 length:156 start_codon:yes stop_codon:yes gene_type:complete
MLTWLGNLLEKFQDSLALAKVWLDTQSNFKNREIVLGGTVAVVALLLALLI